MINKLHLKGILCLFITLFLHSSFTFANSINFIQADFETVAKLGAIENKYFFVNYSADWCTTCKVMEETSNANPTLVNLIDDKFIAVKANVDSPQGKLWQKQYGVTCLPTLIMFSPEGKEVARRNGGITSSEFLIFLEQFESIPNSSYASVNVNPEVQTVVLKSTENSNSIFTKSNNSILTSKGNVVQKETTITEGVKNYGVQVGLYSDLNNANRKIDKLKKRMKQPVMLRYEKIKEKLIYQVIIGEYSQEGDAEQFVKALNSKGFKGYIIEL